MATLCARIRLIVSRDCIPHLRRCRVTRHGPAAQFGRSDRGLPSRSRQLLQQFNRIQGLGTIPDTKSYVIEQPMGRVWREFHEVWLHWIGSIAVLGMLALLIIVLSHRAAWCGSKSGRSGVKIVRFTASNVSCTG